MDVDIWNKPEIQDIVNKIDEQIIYFIVDGGMCRCKQWFYHYMIAI